VRKRLTTSIQSLFYFQGINKCSGQSDSARIQLPENGWLAGFDLSGLVAGPRAAVIPPRLPTLGLVPTRRLIRFHLHFDSASTSPSSTLDGGISQSTTYPASMTAIFKSLSHPCAANLGTTPSSPLFCLAALLLLSGQPHTLMRDGLPVCASMLSRRTIISPAQLTSETRRVRPTLQPLGQLGNQSLLASHVYHQCRLGQFDLSLQQQAFNKILEFRRLFHGARNVLIYNA
jgi:hypothetical protein